MIDCLIVGDGSSDAMLRHVLDWLLNDIYPELVFGIEFADLRQYDFHEKGLSARIEKSLELYDCGLLFVHRDAENEAVEERLQEINTAVAQLEGIVPTHVKVVPVRMTEAWLLIDKGAIRSGANNPNGTVSLELPALSRLDSIVDPKAHLEQLLIQAADLNRRRRKKFRPRKQMHRVAETISDFSPLRVQESFRHLEEQLRALVGKLEN